MKRVKLSLFALTIVLLGACVVSCSEEYESPLQDLPIQDMTFESGSNPHLSEVKEQTFEDKDLKNCVITSDADWCHPRIDSSNSRIIVRVYGNDTYDERRAIVTISDTEDNTTRTFNVIQSQKNALLIDKDNLVIPDEGGEVSINVQSNVNYMVDIPVSATWLTCSKSTTRGLSSSTVVFKADKNNSGDVRETIVKLTDSASGTSSQLTIEQELTPIVTIDNKEFSVDEFGGDYNIAVNSNIPLTINCDADWVVLGTKTSTDDFSFNQKVEVKALPSSTSSRSAKIHISDKAGKWSINKSITIKQTKSLSIQENDFVIYEGESYTLNLINNTGGSVSWKSSNTSVATVNSNGKVTGVREGTAIITVSSADGKYSDQVTVTVKYQEKERLEIKYLKTWIQQKLPNTGSYVDIRLTNKSSENIKITKIKGIGKSFSYEKEYNKQLKPGENYDIELYSPEWSIFESYFTQLRWTLYVYYITERDNRTHIEFVEYNKY